MGSGVGSAIMMTSDPQSNGAETRKPMMGKGQTAAIQISPYNGVVSMNEYSDAKRIQSSSSASNLYSTSASNHNQ